MADQFYRMRQLIGSPAEWAANDLIIGMGEFALETSGGSGRMKLGDGVSRYSQLPFFDPGIFAYVLKAGDTMTGPLIVPELSVTGAANLGANATAANPVSGSDDDTSVATTHWVQQQIGGVISGLTIKGSWNAATNTPALASGGMGVPTPARGDFYIVSVAGTTTLDGISTWAVGDTVVFNGVSWQRVPQTLGYDQVIAGLGFVPVNKAGDTMTGALAGTTATMSTAIAPTSNDTTVATTAFVKTAVGAAGAQIQMASFQSGAVATGTTSVSATDSIPTSGQGDQYLQVTITPRSATSKLVVEVVISLSSSGTATTCMAALFQDATANALAAVAQGSAGTNNITTVNFRHVMTSGTTSSTTFKVRAGYNGAGTTTVNGVASGRIFGGVCVSSIVIREVAA